MNGGPVLKSFLLVIAPCAWSPVRAQNATWKRASPSRVITPETGVWLAGYGTKRPPDGKLHDLWMKASPSKTPRVASCSSPAIFRACPRR